MSTPQRNSRFLLRLMAVLFILSAAVGWSAMQWQDHSRSLAEAEQAAADVAEMMEHHTLATFSAADVALQDVLDLANAKGIDALRGSPIDWQKMRNLANRLPQISAIWIQDADGNAVLGTPQFPLSPINIADRPYFQAHRAGAERYYGEEIRGRTTGKLIFTLSQRLNRADGSFAGVAMVAIDAAFFESTYGGARLGPQSTIGLFRSDGAVLLHHPADGAALGRSVSASDLFTIHLPKAPNGIYHGVSGFDGKRRVYAYHSLPGLPVIAMAAVSYDDALAGWRQRTVTRSLVLFGGTAALLLLAWAIQRALAREEVALRALEQTVEEKEVLFRDLHHRVKNNMQVIASLITIQRLQCKDAAVRAALDGLIERVSAMGLVHETIYHQHGGSDVEIGRYLSDLCRGIALTYDADTGRITMSVRADSCVLKLDQAIPLALVVTEAVVNALKYAFPGDRSGTIEIAFEDHGRCYVLSVRDDGVGVADSAPWTHGTGTQIIETLIEQMGGTLSWTTRGGVALRAEIPTGRVIDARAAA